MYPWKSFQRPMAIIPRSSGNHSKFP
jgi:hypothetical protein